LELLLLNVRVPDERRGDYFAQIAAARLGVRRIGEITASYSIATLESAFDEIVERTAVRMRQALRHVPDGDYHFEDVMDDDGVGAVDIPIRLKLTARDGHLTFDFRECADQVRGNINLAKDSTRAAVVYALKSLFDPEIPNNQAVVNCCDIITRPGSIVDCVFPAAVAARANTAQRIVDVIIGAIANALPEYAVAAANGANTTAVFSGVDPRTRQGYVYLETLGGGFGGRSDRDGRDGVQVHITNTSNLPIEAIETEYPLRVESYGFVPNSGGAGKFRGGLGLRRVVRPVNHTCTFSGAGERFSHKPWGLFGGRDGASGRFTIIEASGTERDLPIKPSSIDVGPNDLLVIESPGSGGYGAPDTRGAKSLLEDKESGKFSAAYIKEFYG
jgi:N-methylhydantoinase B